MGKFFSTNIKTYFFIDRNLNIIGDNLNVGDGEMNLCTNAYQGEIRKVMKGAKGREKALNRNERLISLDVSTHQKIPAQQSKTRNEYSGEGKLFIKEDPSLQIHYNPSRRLVFIPAPSLSDSGRGEFFHVYKNRFLVRFRELKPPFFI